MAQAGRRADAELSDELGAHLDLLVEEKMRSGMPAAEALRLARLEMGGLTQVAEAVRDADRLAWLRRAVQDARYALRLLRRTPIFTVTAAATLAIGVGTNTAIFTVVDAILLRTLPVHDAQRLVVIGNPTSVNGHTTGAPRGDLLSLPLYRDLRDNSRLVTGLAATGTTGRLDVRIEGGAYEHPAGRFVSANYFAVLGVPAVRGRVFDLADDDPAAPSPVAVISDGYWRRRFAGAGDIIGRDILVDGARLTIVGVTPPTFRGEIVDRPTDIWLPIGIESILDPNGAPIEHRGTSWLLLLGRLAPGVTLEQARAGFGVLIHQFLAANATSPEDSAHSRFAPTFVTSGAKGLSAIRASYSGPLITLEVGGALLMLIVCANVGNLLLARAVARRREMSVRLALGASRTRLVAQLLTESAVLAGIGCAGGTALAWLGSRELVVAATGGTSIAESPLNWLVLLFTIALTGLAVVCFGLLPALRGSRGDVASLARGGPLAGSRRVSGVRIPAGRFLIPSQVVVSLVLLVGATLLSRSLERLSTADSGLDRDHLLVVDVDASRHGYTGDRFLALARGLSARIRGLPGAAAVSYSQNGLFSGYTSSALVIIPGFVGQTPGDSDVQYDFVGPGYLRTVGARLLRGRDLAASDGPGKPRVVVVNRAWERFFFGTGSAVGKTIFFDPGSPTTIIGVVSDIRDRSLVGPPEPTAYAPYDQNMADADRPLLVLEVRTVGDPAALMASVRNAIATIDPQLPIASIAPLSTLMRDSIRQEWLLAILAIAFAGVALVLATIGLYGVVAYTVAQRTGEIGLRTAMGATRGRVIALVFGDGLRLLAVGLVVGLPMALLAGHLIGRELHGVTPTDLGSVATAVGILSLCAVGAALIPAWRASRIAPLAALRQS